MSNEAYFDANRKLWNTRTPLHAASAFYDVRAFKAGKSSLCGVELAEMGPVHGKSVLHLQCHFGQDSLSLARLGAEVTGVDFSDESIALARSLASELDIPASFLCCNVFDLPEALNRQFDVVFTSFGVLGWLPDLERWAQVVAHFLKPGGFLYVLEFHPAFTQLNEQGEVAYDYFSAGRPDEEIETKTYTNGAEHEPLNSCWWNHTISDVVMAVLRSGLQISLFNEFPYSAYKLSDAMIEISPSRWVHEPLRDRIPYMFSLRAHRN